MTFLADNARDTSTTEDDSIETDNANTKSKKEKRVWEGPVPEAQPLTALTAQIQGGKTNWTTLELVPYFIALAGGDPVTTTARLGAMVRVYGASVGLTSISKGGKTTFMPGSVSAAIAPPVAPVDEQSVKVRFPSTPELGKPLPSYVEPPWARRMSAALDAGKHVALAGPPGGGKSTAPEQYFVAKGQPFVVVNGDAGFRRRDMEGSVEIAGGSTYFQVADFAAAAVNGWGCILNEVNAADPDALMFINGLLEVPFVVNVHGHSYPVHKDFRLVVTYNPGLVGTKALPQAFKDRFFPIKLGFPPSDFLRKMVLAKTGINPDGTTGQRLTDMLRFAADCWEMHVRGSLRYQISPRRLFDAVFLMETTGCSWMAAIEDAVVAGVDAHADVEMLRRLILAPLKDVKITPASI